MEKDDICAKKLFCEKIAWKNGCDTLQHTATTAEALPFRDSCDTLHRTATHGITLLHCAVLSFCPGPVSCYGVATIGRRLKIIGLFCRISSLL